MNRRTAKRAILHQRTEPADQETVERWFPLAPGVVPTAIPSLSLIRFDQPTALTHGILEPSLCLILQGRKKVLIGRQVIHYGPGDYIVASVHMPLAGHVVEASPQRPYLGVSLQINADELSAVVLEANRPAPRRTTAGRGAYVGSSTPELRDAFVRLVRLHEKPDDIAYLAPRLKQEILYRLVTSPHSHLLWSGANASGNGQAIRQAVTYLQRHFTEPLDLDWLARSAHLSLSAFHRKFKAVTTLSPLQYQKRLRLLEARRQLMTGGFDAAVVAYQMGYESPSQFSREYRRLFGAPPRTDTRRLQAGIFG